LKTRTLLYCVLTLLSLNGFSQENGFWNTTSFNGEVKLRGHYRQQQTTKENYNELYQNLYFSGGLLMNLKSYILHPDFLGIDLSVDYSPETNRDSYIEIPDVGEIRTVKGLKLHARLLNNKPLTLTSYLNWNDNISNRENLTSVKSKYTGWGSSLILKNKILPITASYSNTSWDQLEVQTNRHYTTEQKNLELFTQKSFSSRDETELSISHDYNLRQNNEFSKITTATNSLRFNNRLSFDEENRFKLSSTVYAYNRTGNQISSFFNLNERLTVKLPYNFRFYGSYTMSNQQQLNLRSHKDIFTTRLNHKLFSSLETGVHYRYSNVIHTQQREKRNKAGYHFHYTKKIPTGRLAISYSNSLLRINKESDSLDIHIINEEHQLVAGEIVLLNRPYIDINTILVKDFTASIIYQIGFDYMLIEHGDYVEIQRISGGQIPNGATVYVDYIARQTGVYRYDEISNSINASINLFNSILELYYRGLFIDYMNIEKSDQLILNYTQQNIIGGRIKFRFVEFGTEYISKNSIVSPYTSLRYFININKRVQRLVLSAIGNLRNYQKKNEPTKRQYIDISGKAGYLLSSNSTLSLTVNYQKQRGPGIYLDLYSASAEFKTGFRLFTLSTGVNFYNRFYTSRRINYFGAHIQLSRRF